MPGAIVRGEIEAYAEELADKPELIVLLQGRHRRAGRTEEEAQGVRKGHRTGAAGDFRRHRPGRARGHGQAARADPRQPSAAASGTATAMKMRRRTSPGRSYRGGPERQPCRRLPVGRQDRLGHAGRPGWQPARALARRPRASTLPRPRPAARRSSSSRPAPSRWAAASWVCPRAS